MLSSALNIFSSRPGIATSSHSSPIISLGGIRSAHTRFLGLSREIWIVEILSRLDYEGLKKIETISIFFRRVLYENSDLRMRLFRGSVNEKLTFDLFNILRERPSSMFKKVSYHPAFNPLHPNLTPDEARERFKIDLHPALTTPDAIYHFITRNKPRPTESLTSVYANGEDPSGKGFFHSKTQFQLYSHPIGSELATQPAVGWFRFDFEDQSVTHRGTLPLESIKASSRQYKGVTVFDVIEALIQAKGDKRLAGWFGSEAEESDEKGFKKLLDRQSVFALKSGLQASLKKGELKGGEETIGVEFFGAELEQ